MGSSKSDHSSTESLAAHRNPSCKRIEVPIVTIIGHGIDIVEIGRIQRLLDMPNSEWTRAAFTAAEREVADPPPAQARYFAARYAAKEAVAKALGKGISGDIAWMDIEILRQATGEPTVALTNAAQDVAKELGVTRWIISISHSGAYAVASAIAVRD
jgi:holo-[acyl-carrier protein] synthase